MSIALQEAPVASAPDELVAESRPSSSWLSKLGAFIWSIVAPIFCFVENTAVVAVVLMLVPILLALTVLVISMFLELAGQLITGSGPL